MTKSTKKAIVTEIMVEKILSEIQTQKTSRQNITQDTKATIKTVSGWLENQDKLSVFNSFLSVANRERTASKERTGKVEKIVSNSISNLSKVIDGCFVKQLSKSDEAISLCSKTFRQDMPKGWTRFNSLDSAVFGGMIKVATACIPFSAPKECELCKVKDGQIEALTARVSELSQEIERLAPATKTTRKVS